MKFKNLLLLGFTVSMAVACSSGAKTEVKEGDAMMEEAPVVAENSIVKTWALDGIDITVALAKVPKENQADMKAMMDKMAADQKGKMTLDIQEGGKVVSNSMGMDGKWKEMSGTWKLSDDKKTLTMDIDGKKSDYTVVDLSADKLNIEMQGEGMNMIFVPKN